MPKHFLATKARRDEAAERVRRSERELDLTRACPALGGRSRAVLLQLARRIADERSHLATLEAELAQAAVKMAAIKATAVRAAGAERAGPSA